jgi:acetoacetyl-CoA synthetase
MSVAIESALRPIWTPSPGRAAASNMARFIEFARARGAEVHDYSTLWHWSVTEPAAFWPAVWEFCGVRASHPWEAVLEDGDRMPGAKWFRGARLNFAENLLARREAAGAPSLARGPRLGPIGDEQPALVFRDESGRRWDLSYAELHAAVARLAQALRAEGVTVGDRVAGYLPNLPETVIAMLATTSLGAIWSSCSADFGVGGLLDRFGQIRPKVLFAADGYFYKGKTFDALARTAEVARQLPELKRVVVVSFLAEQPETDAIPNARRYDEFVTGHGGGEIAFEQLPFDHPAYILYSSGTTGKPKCIVHSAGGTLLQHLKELVLHTDLGPRDRIVYFTTCGWMMWNWLVSSLATGATVVLYEGAPFHPRAASLFDLAQEEGVTVFGTSAKYLAAAEKAGVAPARTHDLAPLRAILSTGSSLAPESFDYVYRDVKPDVQLASISGGTDLISCFALGNPLAPVYRGELQCRGLGMAVEVFDDTGRPVRGRKGELACTAPFPSMPVGFWDDADGRKYRAAYFEKFPDVWAHGDYAELTARDGVIIHGRSDAVLNPGGVRIGTAEIYREVEKLPEVLEAIAVGQEWQGDVRVVLFVKLREGLALDDSLIARIKAAIRANTTPRHVPAKILQVPDIPRTLSGKIVELAVREAIHGRPVKNLEALANPEALDYFRDRPELRA